MLGRGCVANLGAKVSVKSKVVPGNEKVDMRSHGGCGLSVSSKGMLVVLRAA